jgi:hypothetical protein
VNALAQPGDGRVVERKQVAVAVGGGQIEVLALARDDQALQLGLRAFGRRQGALQE